MALAFVLRHPGVTSAIIGPRTLEQLEVGQLDRIDEIVTPGLNVDPADTGWTNPALAPAARRRV